MIEANVLPLSQSKIYSNRSVYSPKRRPVLMTMIVFVVDFGRLIGDATG